jgi:hypothetical protein
MSTVTYVYAEVDDQVGRLTETEIAFLEAGGATVISDPGGHVDAIFCADRSRPCGRAAVGIVSDSDSQCDRSPDARVRK